MNLKREVREPIEQRDAGTVRQFRSISTAFRKRIVGILIVIWTALTFAIFVYYRTEYSRSGNDWSSFWVGEAIAGVWLILGIAVVFKETRK